VEALAPAPPLTVGADVLDLKLYLHTVPCCQVQAQAVALTLRTARTHHLGRAGTASS